ncbi:hypothetical protein CONLIGDRAFT_575910 [Coniochaeta ligniaria NRRL 30616]|uniref:HTH TFE/IIEalpha-type domain-containing protein n=1 Tax=Coniochaeta ligniaria NRRL 30616 TaxID=1408157 RepID=A0A1J7JPG1_9PEZI|nr:hypothetical protein CONLIGDRAFT_575910 [Coniochaeta ligniaria NRRL 30616]
MNGSDLAKVLTRAVARAFYETRHVLIIECLLNYSALRDDDLAYLIGMNTKDLHKVCAKLKEDRLLEVYTRPELKEGQTRPVNRTYYWIDFQHTVDAVKWRVYKIDKEMQGTAVPASERKEYFCNFCKASWTQMEVLDNFSAQGFLCHTCNHVLVHDADRHAVGHQKSTRMNNQFKFITDLLPQIDSVGIPEKTFDEAYANARVVERSETHQAVNSVAVETGLNRPTAVKGLANTGPTSLAVSISTGDGPSEEEKAAEQERRDRISKQNALPEWMTVSATNANEKFVLDDKTSSAQVQLKKGENDGNTAKKDALDAKEQADLDDYMARLKAEQAAEAARKAAEEEEEYESGDEDEVDFEDVAPGSGTSTEATSPNAGTPAVDGPPAKKIKMEEEAAPAPADEDDEEDDLEFEDV